MQYFRDQQLSEAAAAMVQFDRDSIRQVVRSQQRSEPDIWLADPEAYECAGHLLRDSPSSRLLAYSSADRILYATDGCNSCTYSLSAPLDTFTDSELGTFAEHNSLRLDLLKRLRA